MAQTVHNRLKHYQFQGRTITLKIKYSDFRQITRNQSFVSPVDELTVIADAAKSLLAATGIENVRVRLLGISLSNFGELPMKPVKPDQSGQLKMF